MKIHHLGINVISLEQATAFYAQLGFYPEAEGPVELKSRGVKVLFLVNDQGTRLELVEKPILEGTPYHLAYQVDGDLEPELAALAHDQWGQVPELGITNAFIFGPGGEKVELVKVKK
ncbi:MAG: VOC family protein [Methylocystaceae bacterium]